VALWIKITLIVALSAGIGTTLATQLGSASWNRSNSRLVQSLRRESTVQKDSVFAYGELDSLPSPVSRYFR